MKGVPLKLKEFQASANRKIEVKVYLATSECGPDLSSFGIFFPPQKTFGVTMETNAGASRNKVARDLSQGLYGLELWLLLEPSRACSHLSYLITDRPCSLPPQLNS